jgi:cysteine-rich repeat protein
MLQRVLFVWAALAVGTLVGCGGGGAGTGGGGNATTSSSSSSSGGGGTGGTGGTPAACGDGTVDTGEACDDGNTTAGDGCDDKCKVEKGYACDGSPSTCTTTCGDGVIAGSEACDDGNAASGDGCSATCAVESGYDCGTAEPSVCVTACGDGVVSGAEACDDGNTATGDGCDDKCKVEKGWDCGSMQPSMCFAVCGDGIVTGAEACDDGNTAAGDGCDDKCAVEVGWDCGTAQPSACSAVCGDGIIAGAEACDDGNAASGDGCDDKCAIESGWVCAGAPSICGTVCGDGVIAGQEKCDDGNTTAADGCDDTCAVEAGWSCTGAPSACVTTCGDGVIAGQEKCDDGNGTAGDGCDAACAVEAGWVCTGAPSACHTACGDGVIAGQEKCDDGNTAGGDGCSAACVVEAGYACAGSPSACSATCGDGFVVAGKEQCDDGNTASADGCSATCAVEIGFTCTGSPSVCATTCGDGVKAGAEQCDDGNAANGDGCSATCTTEAGYGCSGSPSVCAPVCGDGVKLPGEKCDDGNLVNGDCCSSTCQIEAGCEIEPNDTLATANDFSSVSSNNKVKGFINPTADKDVFLIVVPPSTTGTLTAKTLDGPLGTTCASDKVDTYLSLFSDASPTTALTTNDDFGSNFCSQITASGLAPGNYYVEVKKSPLASATATFDYTLQVTLALVVCGNGILETGEQCDDGNTANGDGCSSQCKLEALPEAEPNNTCATANGPYDLPPNVLVSASCSPAGDQDWFRFTLPTFADVQLETFDAGGPGSCSPTTVDTEMQVFKSDCTTSLGAAVDQGGINNCTRIGPASQPYMKHLAPGTYYVKVFPFSSTATYNYTLLMTLPALCGNGVVEGSEQCDGGPFCQPDCTTLPLGNGGIGGSLTGSALPKVAIATTSGTYATLQSKLQATGSFATVDYLSASSTLTVAQLSAYDALAVYTFGSTSATFGDNLATYFEAGGGVVLFDYETQESSASGLSGQFETLYALSTKISSSSWLSAGFTLGTILEPASPLMSGVTTFKSASTSGAYHLPASAFNKNSPIVVASYTDGSPAVVRGVVASGPAAGRNLVEINCYGSASPTSSLGWDGTTTGDKLVRNALLFSIPPPVVTVAKGLDLGAQAVSTTGPSMALTYTNASSAPQTLTALGITGANAADFAAAPSSGLPVTIPPGGTFVVNVTFSPSAAGPRSATVGATFTGFANPATTLLVGTGM